MEPLRRPKAEGSPQGPEPEPHEGPSPKWGQAWWSGAGEGGAADAVTAAALAAARRAAPGVRESFLTCRRQTLEKVDSRYA